MQGLYIQSSNIYSYRVCINILRDHILNHIRFCMWVRIKGSQVQGSHNTTYRVLIIKNIRFAYYYMQGLHNKTCKVHMSNRRGSHVYSSQGFIYKGFTYIGFTYRLPYFLVLLVHNYLNLDLTLVLNTKKKLNLDEKIDDLLGEERQI